MALSAALPSLIELFLLQERYDDIKFIKNWQEHSYSDSAMGKIR